MVGRRPRRSAMRPPTSRDGTVARPKRETTQPAVTSEAP